MKRRNRINKKWGTPMRIFIVFLFFIGVLYVQLFRLSAFAKVDNINMERFAKMRNTENRKIYATRGTIYDKDGNTLALNVASYTVIAYLDESRTTNPKYPYHVIDKETTAELLAPILNMDASYILNLLSKKLYQVELGPGGREISELKKDEIIDLNLPGISFIENHKRFYPNGNFASYLIGYAKGYEEVEKTGNGNKINYNIVGELGIEAKYDDALRGIDGQLKFQKDRHGYKIPDTKEERIEAINGNDIYLTIDSTIQRFIEEELKEAYEKYDPKWFQINVMDAKTGQILGSATTPSFDPNLRNIENYENALTSYVFEPGSTMKIYTYMCAIESGKYKADDVYESGKINVGGSVIRDWNNTGWGAITYDKGFEYSSNVAIVNLTKNVIDKNELLTCFKKYGFGQKTGIELPRELGGTLKFNYDIEVATAGFGQGINTTAIQHLQALTIIANDGAMLKPQIIDKIINPNTKEIIYESKVERVEGIVSSTTTDKMQELMYSVIYGNGAGTTGTKYRIDEIDILGKTGTSQIYENGRYLTGSNDYIYSFAGMFPKEDPEIIIYVAMKQPSYGNGTAIYETIKPLILNIAKYRNMYNKKKDNDLIFKYELPSYLNKNVLDVKKELQVKGIEPIILGNGNRIINQYPLKGDFILTYEKVFLETNDSKSAMPDMIGWSRNEVISFCNMVDLKYEFEGYGYVDSQSIDEGLELKKKDSLKIILKQKFDLEDNEEEEEIE